MSTYRHSRRPRIRAVAVAAVAALLLALAGCGGSSSRPQELRIAYQDIAGGALVVKHNGWLEDKLQMPVRWIRYDSGSAVNAAVNNGKVDVGLVGSTGAAAGVTAHLGYQVVWIFDVIGKAEALVARSGSGITSVRDLVGKTVAVPFGSTSHYALLAALQDANVNLNDVTMVDLQPREIADAWRKKSIDAAYVWQPTQQTLLDDGGHVVIDSAQLAHRGHFTADLGFATADLVKSAPAIVQTWITQENRAVTLIQKDPATAAKAIGAELGISDREARQEMTGYRYLTASQQAGPGYLGTPNAKGKLVNLLTAAADFQHEFPQTAKFGEEKVITTNPTTKQFSDAIDPAFIANAGG
ncbi:ABC transporter substrate-binding protein [Leekyejoonella antrihumi]|uniref:Glycine/betaine ABC transporter substrate-binding protein n=1 Tax=Leekyejoonella antrihumi TaxID=1660198 RepID=A0A563DYC3_9MICO|nr:ABC transporter substrate-binding protein [Leekyejoonella antrihumi]TWP34972.1 glycine/betaine ABC transporter substrate-binding protein [Leekyejoonella antrihumi]